MNGGMMDLHRLIARAGLRPPRVVTIVVTKGCNLSCVHCWTESPAHGTVPPVPVDTLKRVIRAFSLLPGVEEIWLTGGEPLTHPDWFEILSFTCRRSGLKGVRLQTNATLLTGAHVEALASMECRGLTVQVSLEGATARTNDRVRGEGSFERVLQALKLLARAGMGPQVVVEFTEMEHNFGELPDLLFLLKGLRIERLVSGTLVQGGRAAGTPQVAPPRPTQYVEILDLYCSDPRFRSLYQRLGNIAAIEWFRGKAFPASRVCTCVERPYINGDGKIYPCLMLPVDGLAVPGVHHRPLEEVLMEALPIWAELPRLSRRRSLELKACRDCPGRRHCAGGCMGRTYAATGDFMNVEDRCELRRAVYTWEAPQKSGPATPRQLTELGGQR